MIERRSNNYHALLCDDCGVEIFVDSNMVMLNDTLWSNISDNHEDSYCDCCIEKRIGRKIKVSDFKPISGIDITGTNLVPCNAFWLWENRRDEYLKMFPIKEKF